MSKYWYEAFITQIQNYVLLDSEGDIRASSSDIEGIVRAQIKFGWGNIHKMEFDGKTLKIGKEIK